MKVKIFWDNEIDNLESKINRFINENSVFVNSLQISQSQCTPYGESEHAVFTVLMTYMEFKHKGMNHDSKR